MNVTCERCSEPATHNHENKSSGEVFNYCERCAAWAKTWFGGKVRRIKSVPVSPEVDVRASFAKHVRGRWGIVD